MTLGLDTSVVVRLLIGEPAAQAARARQLLTDRGVGAPVLVSDMVVGEAYFVLRHHYAVPHARAVAALRALLADARVSSNGVARPVLAAVPDVDRAPGLMDRLIHGDYGREGAAVATFDRDAARLEGALRLE